MPATEEKTSLTIYELNAKDTNQKIYIDHEGLRGSKRRFFMTLGATAYSELFVKTVKGEWVGEMSNAVGFGARLIRTKYNTWILNTYQIRKPEKNVYPRQFLSDSGQERSDIMNKGVWGQALEEDQYQLLLPHEARSWLTAAGFDVETSDFTGIDFETKRVPGVMEIGTPKLLDDKPPLEV